MPDPPDPPDPSLDPPPKVSPARPADVPEKLWGSMSEHQKARIADLDETIAQANATLVEIRESREQALHIEWAATDFETVPEEKPRRTTSSLILMPLDPVSDKTDDLRAEIRDVRRQLIKNFDRHDARENSRREDARVLLDASIHERNKILWAASFELNERERGADKDAAEAARQADKDAANRERAADKLREDGIRAQDRMMIEKALAATARSNMIAVVSALATVAATIIAIVALVK